MPHVSKYGPVCTVDGCGKPHRSRGFCNNHWYHWRKHVALDSEIATRRSSDECLYRDELGRKQCVRCLEWISVGGFGASGRSPDKLNYYCLNCISFINKFNRLKCKYNVTPQKLDDMLRAQAYKCGICMSDIDLTTLHVDHDHSCCPDKYTCGKCVRGLLCSSCNTGIGLLKDSADNLAAAIDYLTNGIKEAPRS